MVGGQMQLFCHQLLLSGQYPDKCFLIFLLLLFKQNSAIPFLFGKWAVSDRAACQWALWGCSCVLQGEEP